jgi:hypothetical protein
MSEVKLLMGVVPPVLDLTKATTFNSWSLSKVGSVSLWRTAFSYLSLSSSCEVAVECSSYVVKHIRYCFPVLAVLCFMLNKYYAYMAIAIISMLKWGP